MYDPSVEMMPFIGDIACPPCGAPVVISITATTTTFAGCTFSRPQFSSLIGVRVQKQEQQLKMYLHLVR